MDQPRGGAAEADSDWYLKSVETRNWSQEQLTIGFNITPKAFGIADAWLKRQLKDIVLAGDLNLKDVRDRIAIGPAIDAFENRFSQWARSPSLPRPWRLNALDGWARTACSFIKKNPAFDSPVSPPKKRRL